MGVDNLWSWLIMEQSTYSHSYGESYVFYPVGGAWLIFPIIGLAVMLVMLALMFRPGDRSGGWGPWCMGGEIRRDRGGHQDADALEILRQRYAAGELSAEQFDAMRQRLDGR